LHCLVFATTHSLFTLYSSAVDVTPIYARYATREAWLRETAAATAAQNVSQSAFETWSVAELT
jgi:hypothetical protein